MLGVMPRIPATKDQQKTTWYVYMVRCRDQSLYTGITVDAERRLRQHNGELVNGSRYTRQRRPVELVYLESQPSRSTAGRREHALKRLSKSSKEALIIAYDTGMVQALNSGQ